MWLICLLLFVSGSLFSQTPVVVKNTFQVSHDVTDAPIPQTDPRLYFNEDYSFIVAWEDRRFGFQDYYFRRFSNTSAFLTEPAPIIGNSNIVFTGGDDDFIATTAKWVPYMFDDQFYSVSANIYHNNQMVPGGIYVGGYATSWCGTGWMGFSYSLLPTSDGLYSFVTNNGNIFSSKFDSALTPIFENQETGIVNAIYSTTSKTADNRPALFWVNQPWDSWGENFLKIFARFYDSNDSMVVDSVLLFEGRRDWDVFGTETSAPIVVEPIGTDAYIVYYVTSQKIYYTRISHNGTFISSVDSLAIPSIPAHNNVNLEQVTHTNRYNGMFDIVLRHVDADANMYYYTAFQFDLQGTPSGVLSNNSPDKRIFGKKIFKWGTYSYYYPATIDDDVYLITLNNFNQLDQKLICVDPQLSNESNMYLTGLPNGKFISGFQNEKGIYGVQTSVDATPNGTQQQINAKGLSVYVDGTLFELKNIQINDGYIHVVNEYTDELLISSSDTIRALNSAPLISSLPMAYIERNDNLLMFIIARGQSLVGGTMDRDYQILSENELTTVSNLYSLKISKENDNSYLINYNQEAMFVNSQFDVTSEVFQGVYGTHVGQDVIVLIYNTFASPVSQTNMKVKSLRTGTETDEFVGYPGQDFKIERVDDSRFLLYYREIGNKVNCIPYRLNGTKLRNAVTLVQEELEFKNFLVTDNGNYLMVTWSGHGSGTYDIYGKVFTLTSVTDIAEAGGSTVTDYSLLQNYPNPFNPETNITYSLPFAGLVELKVYDALGRLAAVIESGEKQAGTHTVTLDGSKFASGIYFCEMKAGSYRSVIKMILMK